MVSRHTARLKQLTHGRARCKTTIEGHRLLSIILASYHHGLNQAA